MPSPQKSKGNAFERVVADDITRIFEQKALRVPTSGAFTGGMNAHRLDDLSEEQKRIMHGDIIVPPCLSKFKIECKSYADIEFHKFFSECKKLDRWIEQAQDDELWFLIFKITRKGVFIVFDKSLDRKFKFNNYTRYKKRYTITSYDGFFEANKQNMLCLNENSSKNSQHKI